MKTFCRLCVLLACLFGGIKSTEVYAFFPREPDLSHELVAASHDPFWQPGLLSEQDTFILPILVNAGKSQITNTVIKPVAVSVVNLNPLWYWAINQFPYHPMAGERNVLKKDAHVPAFFRHPARFSSGKLTVPNTPAQEILEVAHGSFSPNQNPHVGFVLEAPPKVLLINLASHKRRPYFPRRFFSHGDWLLDLGGQTVAPAWPPPLISSL